MLEDSAELRDLLHRLLPGIDILDVAKKSGQRVVYYCKSDNQSDDNEPWLGHGNVVLKASEGVSAQQIAYIQKEIEILNSLDSDYYPDLLYNEVFGEDPDTEDKLPNRLFVTLEEHIESKSLFECKADFSDEVSVVCLLVSLVSALRLLWEHQLRLVHRDIKPENILIKPNGDVVVIDLGILREEGSDGHTCTHWDFGPCTIEYSSPEQAKNDKRNISFKSDFFALGTLAYELLSGVKPYGMVENTSPSEVLSNVINNIPEELHSINACTKELSDIVRKLMEKEPYRRYRTVEQFNKELVLCQEMLNGN